MSRDLPPDLRALVRVSACLASGDAAALDEALARASIEAREREVEEALLQSYLFLGYPAALNALALWRSRTGETARGDAEGDDPMRAVPDAWAERGVRTCRLVYGDQYEGLRRNVRRIHPDLDTWMVTEGYGKVLGRPGLELGRRELCIVAILARQGAAVERQLYSHLRGALRVGVSAGAVEAALHEALAEAPERARKAALSVWARVRTRTHEGSSGPDAGREEAPGSATPTDPAGT